MWVVDPEGLIRFANPAAIAALGHDSADEDRLHAERPVHEHDAALEAQQASLRRVAGLVAGGAASEEVFAAIAGEVAQVIGLPLVAVWRYEPDGTAATVIGAWSERPNVFETGTRWPLDGP